MRHVDEGMLNAWLDGAVGGDAAAELREHLAACPECGARYDAAARLRDQASAILAEAEPAGIVPPSFAAIRARAATRSAAHPAGPAPASRRALVRPRTLAWAASISVALGGAWWAYELGGPGARPGPDVSGRTEAVQPAPAVSDRPGSAAPAASAASPGGLGAPRGMPGAAAAPAAQAEYAGADVPAGAPGGARKALASAPDSSAIAKAAAPLPPPSAAAILEAPRDMPLLSEAAPRAVVAPESVGRMDMSLMHQPTAREVSGVVAHDDVHNAIAVNVEAAPTFTPYTVAPVLRNRDNVRAALARFYPPMLKDAGVGGETLIWLLIDEKGLVMKTQVKKSSGYAQLDDAALKVGAMMRFSPGLNRDLAVKVWAALPIVFKAGA